MTFFHSCARTVGGTLLLAALAAAPAHAAAIDIVAGYDYSDPTYVADSFFTVVNSSSSTLSNIVFTSIGDGSVSSSDTATWSWSGLSIASGSSYTLYFPTTATGVSGTGYGFTADYEYTLFGNDQTYTFSGLAGGLVTSATFSPTANATGGFVAFLGNDASGDSLPVDVSATVASVTLSAVSPVPEPATAWLLGGGLVAVFAMRRKVRISSEDVRAA